MELILFIGGLLLLDLLAMRFGVDSRALNLRAERGWWPDQPTGDPHRDFVTSRRIQLHYEAEVERLVSLAGAGRTSLSIPPVNGWHSVGADPAPKLVRWTRTNHRPACAAAAPLNAAAPLRNAR